MNITFVFPRFKMLTGAEHLSIEFANGLVKNGHSVNIVTRNIEKNCLERIEEDIKVILPKVWNKLSGIHFIDSIFDLLFSPLYISLLPKSSDVFIFWNDNTIASMWLYKKIYKGKIPSIYYCLQPAHWAYDRVFETIIHNLPLSLLIPVFIYPYRFIDRRLVDSADKVIVLSQYMKEVCENIYGKKDISIVHAGIHWPDNSEVKLKDTENDKPVFILSVGKLIPKKNFKTFIKVIHLLKKNGKNVKASILGDGPQKETLVKLVDRLGLKNYIEFIGYVKNDDDVFSAYNNCDIYMYLEKNVPFGLTVLEAGIRGKPVIAASGGGVNETIKENKTGFIVKNINNLDEVYNYTKLLIEDEALRNDFGRNATRHVKKFEYKKVLKEFESQIASTVNNE